MTNKELEQRINKLEQELAELKKVKIEEPKRWKPERGEDYWYITHCGEIDSNRCLADEVDDWRYQQGNCFKTKEEAEHYKRKVEVKAIYKNYILENSEPLDWDDMKNKYSAVYDYDDNKVGVDFCICERTQGTIYASSREIIQQALDLIPEKDRYMLFEE